MIKSHRLDGLELFSCLPATQGQKTPLLFIHGAFAGAWMWTETFMPYFAEAGYPCYALSLRGHGGSEGHEHLDWHSIADYVDDVRKVATHIGEEPVLIGHSMGGFVLQKYLEHYPAAAAMLLCSVPPQGLVASQFHLMLQKPHLFMEINRIVAGNYTDTSTLQEALFVSEIDKGTLTGWLHRMQSESHRAIWDMSMFNLPNLHRMERPPMWVGGAEKDVLVPAFLVQSTAQTYGQKAHIFRNMGHAVTHEKEWPQVAATLRHWLEENVKP